MYTYIVKSYKFFLLKKKNMANKEVCRTFSKLSLLKYCLLIVIVTQQTSCAFNNQNKQSQRNENPSNILSSEPEKLIEGNDISQNNQDIDGDSRNRKSLHNFFKSGENYVDLGFEVLNNITDHFNNKIDYFTDSEGREFVKAATKANYVHKKFKSE